MPSRWKLLLRPHDTTRTTQVPPTQLHGLACAILERAGADHTAQTKPFSVAPLFAAPDNSGRALLQLGWLDDGNPPGLDRLVGREVRLGSQYFTVDDTHSEMTLYDALRSLAATPAATFEFRSITYFTRDRIQIPLPDPRLVFQSLIRRWNAFSTVPLLATDALLDAVIITDTEIHTSPIDLGKSTRTGFRGTATFQLLRTTRHDLASTLATLSSYADVAGVGAQTTHGLGWVATHRPDRPPSKFLNRETATTGFRSHRVQSIRTGQIYRGE